jgi:hypothetical protein
MILLRRYLWHVLFGLAVGAASFELCQYTLADAVPPWLLCAIAVAFVLVMEFAVAEARDRRTRRPLPHRRAHARTTPDRTRKDGVRP